MSKSKRIALLRQAFEQLVSNIEAPPTGNVMSSSLFTLSAFNMAVLQEFPREALNEVASDQFSMHQALHDDFFLQYAIDMTEEQETCPLVLADEDDGSVALLDDDEGQAEHVQPDLAAELAEIFRKRAITPGTSNPDSDDFLPPA